MGLISAIKSVLGIDGADRSVGGTDVTVEREPDASTERAVKTDDTGTDQPGADAERDAETATGGDTASDEDAGAESVDEIKGIGPAYADRLADAGVQSVADLAAADAAALDEATGIGEARIETWIERAAARAT